MLTLLLGRSGSGKTTYILNEIEKRVKTGEKTYLLVPEQQVYISECMLASLPASSVLYFEVVSFSRLCEIVFGKYGGVTDRSATNAARSLIMWQTLRELSSAFVQYKGIKTDATLSAMMLSTVDELRSNSVTPTMCAEIAEACQDTNLANKLSDIAAIYQLFEENIKERIGESEAAAEDKLTRLFDILSKKDFFSGCYVYVDSFTSFTKEEQKVLERIISQAKSTCISLTYEKGSKAPHFESVRDTYNKLSSFAECNRIELKEYYRSESPELQMLEKHLWDFSVTDKTLPAIDEQYRGSIEMHKCLNEYEEIWLAALNIKKERERGVKYSEIALITRDPESKRGMIDAIFEQMGIPYFFSERTDLSTTAPARLILSALRCIAHNFNSTDVITLLKTGLLGIDPHDADLFQDYCYTWNISGKLFTQKEPWSMNPDGYVKQRSDRAQIILNCANRVRDIIIPPLTELRNSFSINKGNTTENCRALYTYLTKTSLSQHLSDQAEYALSTGDVKGAGELLRLYDYIISTLTDISTLLQDTETSAEELFSAIEIMLRNTDIGSVPAMSDYVTVGSAATLRIENIKSAILIGLCEGEFPSSYSDGGILTENDKAAMEKLSVSLTSRENTAISEELFYVYRAMTKPSERLILSCCTSSVSGRVRNPSSAWNRVAFLFPHIKAKTFDLSYIRAISSSNNATSEPDTEQIAAEDLVEGTRGDVVEIDPAFVRSIFTDKLHLSKSRISAFAECPYKYWCEYVLKLREQKVNAISYADSGTTIHYVLENAIKELCDKDGKLKKVDDSELVELVDSILEKYVSEISCPLPPSMMYSFSRLRDLSLIMVKSVMDELDSSLLRIVAFEQAISDRQPDALKPLEIKVNENEEFPIVSLGGVIDRIDCYDGEDKKYVRIIDYKTGTHKFNVEKIATGEDLQLPAYLFTATLEKNKGFFGDGKEVFPASAQFLSAEESGGTVQPVRSGFLLKNDEFLRAMSEELDPKILGMSFKNGETKSKSALNEDGINNVDTVMRHTISDTAKKMYSGKAPRTPSREACGFCSMKATCPVANKDK